MTDASGAGPSAAHVSGTTPPCGPCRVCCRTLRPSPAWRTGPRFTPRYGVTTLDGAHLSSESLRGKVVLVNVWATWCGPCRAEMPLLERMYARHRDAGFVLLGLSVDRGPAEPVRAFVRQRGVTYPVALVGPEGVGAFGGVRGCPTSFLIGRDGVVRHQVLGPLAPASLEPAVRRLLAARGGDRAASR